MESRSYAPVRLASALGSAMSVMITAAAAQDIGATTDAATATTTAIELAPLVVTGERRERSIYDTASSVSVVTEEDIEKKAEAANVQDVLKDLPNVLYPGATGRAPVIRGQDTQGPNTGAGAFFSGTVPRASISVDGHYQNYFNYVQGATSIWDVKSVEVFRGPQTSSQGANSIAGAIVVNTKDPTFQWEGGGQAVVGSEATRRGSAVVSGPLSDQVAIRAAFDYHERDTFIDYTNPAFQKGNSDQDLDALTGRFKLLIVPDAVPGLTGKLTVSLNDTNRPTQEAAYEPYGDYDNASTSLPSWTQDTRTAIADIDYDFGNGIALFNTTQYSRLDANRVTSPLMNGNAMIDQKNASQESRVTFGGERDTLSGVIGVRAERTTSDEVLLLARGTSTFKDTKSNVGLYTEATVRPLDRLAVTGGLRYQRDKVERKGTSPYAGDTLDYDETFDDILPRLSVAYDFTPSVTAGVLVSKGYNPGGVSLNLVSGDYATFDQETVWNYEIFSRASLMDDRLFLNTNLFYSDFTDAQRFVQVPAPGVLDQSITVNAEEAYSYGLELSADYRVLDTLQATIGVGLLQTEITEFTNAIADYEGSEFGRAPSHTLTLGLEWAATPDLSLGGTVRYTGSYYSDDENDPDNEIDAYTSVDLRADYQIRNNVNLFGYVTNALDSAEPTFIRSVRLVEADVQPPRAFGLGIRASF
jgi:outer membrane receptor protein involved in Fe transport